jgi:hypothetical protein
MWKARFADVYQQNNITCVATGSDNVFFGSADGVVRILSQAFKVVRSFKAHDTGSITHMKQVQGTSLLVTISEDLSNEPILKVWALDKLEKKTGIPRCQSTLSIQNGRKQFPVSSIKSRTMMMSYSLILKDICLCRFGRSFTTSNRICEWLCYRCAG